MTAEFESVDEALDRAAKAIDNADVVALACHVTPDGDALGSVLALASRAARGREAEHRLVPERRSGSRRTTATSRVSSC